MSEYRVIRLMKSPLRHLIISRVDDRLPTGGAASCPTGGTIDELKDCLQAMMDATAFDIIERDD